MSEYEIRVTVQPDEIDELEHVNNAVYVRYIEAVARAHSDARGYTLEKYMEMAAVPVVRQHRITYLRPARAGDELTLKTRIGRVSGVRAVREVKILRGDELLVEAETEWVWVDPATMRPMKVPAEVVAAFS